MKKNEVETRREFLRGVARGGVLGVLGAVGFVLGRRSVSRPTGQDCSGRGYCRGCGRRDDCGLPAAVSARLRSSSVGD